MIAPVPAKVREKGSAARMKREMTIEEVDTDMLRAWADAGIITTSRYQEEMDRRKSALAGRVIILADARRVKSERGV